MFTFNIPCNYVLSYYIIGQRKAFYRPRTSEPNCERKEIVDIDIFITSRKSKRKIIQCIRTMSGSLARIIKQNQFNQFRFLCVGQNSSFRQMTTQLLYLPRTINCKILIYFLIKTHLNSNVA